MLINYKKDAAALAKRINKLPPFTGYEILLHCVNRNYGYVIIDGSKEIADLMFPAGTDENEIEKAIFAAVGLELHC